MSCHPTTHGSAEVWRILGLMAGDDVSSLSCAPPLSLPTAVDESSRGGTHMRLVTMSSDARHPAVRASSRGVLSKSAQKKIFFCAETTVEKFEFCFVEIDAWIFVRVVQLTHWVLEKKFVVSEREFNAELSSTSMSKLSQKNQIFKIVVEFSKISL